MEGYRRFSSTKGFVQLGQDVVAIIGSAYPGFGFGGRNSAGQ
jgi:hypothetical protein